MNTEAEKKIPIHFYKYQAVGNDFVVIDNRKYKLSKDDRNKWSRVCDRKMGIGADGVLLLEEEEEGSGGVDFKMVYLNADGGEAEMCGNGARSITHFAHFVLALKTLESNYVKYSFQTAKAIYNSYVTESEIKVEMTNIKEEPELEDKLRACEEFAKEFVSVFFINTGVPHLVLEVESKRKLEEINLKEVAPFFRYHKMLTAVGGANVNFFTTIASDSDSDSVFVRTYERGVEDETLSCGTGAVAVALTMIKNSKISRSRSRSRSRSICNKQLIIVKTKGGELKVSFDSCESNSSNSVFLGGQVEKVFEGDFLF
ncbi:MAG: diaminopimelate epimerase [Oligoflexia bacterium]|nr:diaminopimelate epimerase [Oligoflexia bacterium]